MTLELFSISTFKILQINNTYDFQQFLGKMTQNSYQKYVLIVVDTVSTGVKLYDEL